MKKKAAVLIRGLDPAVVAALKARAEANGRSLESELRLVLTREAGMPDSVAREEAPTYDARVEDRPKRATIVMKPPFRFEPFEPIDVQGEPISETIIRERR